MTREQAQAAIDRRAAVAVLAGAMLGHLPLLWLIREALDDYNDACEGRARPTATYLLASGGHDFALDPGDERAIVIESDSHGSAVRYHEASNASLVLHDAVRLDPVRAEKLLRVIESATEAVRK